MTGKQKSLRLIMEFFGASFKPCQTDPEEIIAEFCPFCGKDKEHFFLNVKKNTYCCHSCKEAGKTVDWLMHVWMHAKTCANSDTLLRLAETRNLPVEAFSMVEIGYYYDLYWLPVYNEKRELVSLRYINPGHKARDISAGSTGMFNIHGKSYGGSVYICEGEMDCVALTWLLKEAKQPGHCISIPGSHTFKRSWKPAFTNNDVVLCFDNDEAGNSGALKVKAILTGKKKVKKLFWDPNFPSKYDLNALISAYGVATGKTLSCFDVLNKMIRPFEEKKRFDMSHIPEELSFPQLLEQFKLTLDVNDDFEKAIKLSMACVLALQLGGTDPIWMFLVGPPGYGKTALLSSMQYAEQCEFLSSINRQSLVSGFDMPDGSDPSVLSRMHNRLLVLKDWTEVLQMHSGEKADVIKTLRGVYDERIDRLFGNAVFRSYKVTMGMLAGVTDEIQHYSDAAMGDRFLRFSLDIENVDYAKQQKMAALSAIFGTKKREDLKLYVKRFLEQKRHIALTDLADLVTSEYLEKLVPLARMTAMMQTEVRRHDYGATQNQVSYKTRPISGNRLQSQFLRLSLALAIVENKSVLDNDIYQLVRRVAIDTVESYESTICKHLAKRRKCLTRKEIASELCISPSSTSIYLENLILKRIIKQEKHPSLSNGKAVVGFKIDSDFLELWGTC